MIHLANQHNYLTSDGRNMPPSRSDKPVGLNTGAEPVLGPNCIWYHSLTPLPTRFKRLKKSKSLCNVYYLSSFSRFRLFIFTRSDIYLSRWQFLQLTAVKFRLVWKISDKSIKTSPQTYATYFLILWLSSLYFWYVGRLFFNTQTTDFKQHYC